MNNFMFRLKVLSDNAMEKNVTIRNNDLTAN